MAGIVTTAVLRRCIGPLAGTGGQPVTLRSPGELHRVLQGQAEQVVANARTQLHGEPGVNGWLGRGLTARCFDTAAQMHGALPAAQRTPGLSASLRTTLADMRNVSASARLTPQAALAPLAALVQNDIRMFGAELFAYKTDGTFQALTDTDFAAIIDTAPRAWAAALVDDRVHIALAQEFPCMAATVITALAAARGSSDMALLGAGSMKHVFKTDAVHMTGTRAPFETTAEAMYYTGTAGYNVAARAGLTVVLSHLQFMLPFLDIKQAPHSV